MSDLANPSKYPWTLHITVLEARNLQDTRSFTKQSTYCNVKFKGEKWATEGVTCVTNLEKQNPKWQNGDPVSIKIQSIPNCCVAVDLKYGAVPTSKLIGSTVVLARHFLHGDSEDRWFAIQRESKYMGDVRLQVWLEGDMVAGVEQLKQWNRSRDCTSSQQGESMISAILDGALEVANGVLLGALCDNVGDKAANGIFNAAEGLCEAFVEGVVDNLL